MNIDSQIDAALRRIGRTEPPAGMESRVLARLDAPRRGLTAVHSISAFAIAASITIAALALGPLVGELGLRHDPGMNRAVAPRVAVPAKGAFGAASAVHVPSAPLAIVPTPVNHGRGHTRGGRASGSHGQRAAGVVPGRRSGSPAPARNASARLAAASAGSASIAPH